MVPLFSVTFVPLFVAGYGFNTILLSILVCGIASFARKMTDALFESAMSDPAGSNSNMSVACSSRVLPWVEVGNVFTWSEEFGNWKQSNNLS